MTFEVFFGNVKEIKFSSLSAEGSLAAVSYDGTDMRMFIGRTRFMWTRMQPRNVFLSHG